MLEFLTFHPDQPPPPLKKTKTEAPLSSIYIVNLLYDFRLMGLFTL